MGYYRAGFEVVGVDLSSQLHYPFEFHQANALDFSLKGFDAIHASPPCQRFSVNTKRWNRQEAHPDLVEPIRRRLLESELPYIIENVPGAPLLNPLLLCGSMWGWKRLRRHRLFESNIELQAPAPCNHKIQFDVISVVGHAGGSSKRDGSERFGGTDLWRELMGIPWMTGSELAESIPPTYTEWLGAFLIRHILRGESGYRQDAQS